MVVTGKWDCDSGSGGEAGNVVTLLKVISRSRHIRRPAVPGDNVRVFQQQDAVGCVVIYINDQELYVSPHPHTHIDGVVVSPSSNPKLRLFLIKRCNSYFI